jgi:hypothetical protein
MKKRAAIELSTNFMVGLIFGIVLFGFGLAFTFNIFNSAQDFQDMQLPDYFDALADQCVQRGDKVCIPETKKEVRVGQAELFGVIINNIVGKKASFRPVFTFSRAMLDDDTTLTGNAINADEWTASFRSYEIPNNGHEIIDIPIQVPGGTKSGDYLFNIRICYSESSDASDTCSGADQYAPPLRITVAVP